MTKRFSVLLSVYRKEKPEYLKISLNSIWENQTVKPSQIVIVKDGPLTQELDEILEDFSNKAPVKFVINTENIGLSASLNRGLLECDNDLVARMDTDDIAMPERFEKQIEFFECNPDYDIVGSFAIKINKNGDEYGNMRVPVENKDIHKLIWTNPFIHPSVMFKKGRIIQAGNYEIPIDKRVRHDDYELWFRCAHLRFQFYNIPEYLLKYRLVADTVMKNDFFVAWNRFKVGFKGSIKLRCSPLAYIGLTFPLIRSFLPYPLNVFFNKFMIFINPRTRLR